MRLTNLVAGALLCGTLGLITGLVQPAAAQSEPERFQIEPMGDGVLRLDRTTGAVEMCAEGEPLLDCRIVVEPVSVEDGPTIAEADLIAENQRLSEEVAALRERLARIAALAGEVDAEAVGDEEPGPFVTTARREIDEALELTDYALRRFRDLYKSLTEEPASE